MSVTRIVETYRAVDSVTVYAANAEIDTYVLGMPLGDGTIEHIEVAMGSRARIIVRAAADHETPAYNVVNEYPWQSVHSYTYGA